ncbi:hypothetical protein SPACI_052470 [Sporomusa acidovorans DSM 3132]|uniref:Uncharacterized protein n=1 Tax=Sporomusa acidovorans (strain ATCC 49682 / DSM 3132 / Mol) TaxID=1123286 RepID=A0ABZ3JB60_SPOA4|nr:hypothetical protein SPACI_18680 [Sporomusa acidovorans DSM 3132]SDD56729.1 hypothetical protein SAMN04488499_100265 [Sporomusa acidovorans]
MIGCTKLLCGTATVSGIAACYLADWRGARQ